MTFAKMETSDKATMVRNGLRRCDAPRSALALFAVLCTLSNLAHAQTTTAAGFTPGSFAVSPSGAATYTIPIRVPPGIGGVGPQLTPDYTTPGGDGVLRPGWGVAGLMAV